MPSNKLVIFGNQGAGKTQVTQNIRRRSFHVMEAQTTGAAVHTVKQTNGNNTLIIWDMGGSEIYRAFWQAYFHDADIGVYCIDLTASDLSIKQIKCDIENFKASAPPHAELIILGTKRDLSADRKVTLDEIVTQLGDSLTPKACFEIAANVTEEESKTQFLNLLWSLSSEISLKKIKPLPWKNIWETFKISVNSLPEKQRDQILYHLDQLEISLTKTSSVEDKIQAIGGFYELAAPLLKDEAHWAYKSLLILAAVLVVTLLVGVIGFAAGAAAGFWSGPGAFFTGLITGVAAAEVVLTTSVSLGLIGGGLTAYGLFKPLKTPLIDDFVEGLKPIVQGMNNQ